MLERPLGRELGWGAAARACRRSVVPGAFSGRLGRWRSRLSSGWWLMPVAAWDLSWDCQGSAYMWLLPVARASMRRCPKDLQLQGGRLPHILSCRLLEAIATSVPRPHLPWPRCAQPVTECGRDTEPGPLLENAGSSDGDPGWGTPRQTCRAFPEWLSGGAEPPLLRCRRHRATFPRATVQWKKQTNPGQHQQ